jgi:hypothetical protein
MDHAAPLSLTLTASPPRRRVRWVAGVTLGMCALTLTLLLAISSNSVAWKSTSALRQSVHFLYHQNIKRIAPSRLQRQRPPQLTDGDGEKGIILCLHDGIVSMGASLIRELRCLGNTDVIQVYHCFPDELSPASQELLTRHDDKVEIVDACSDLLDSDTVFRGNRVLATTFGSYWLKPLALYHTRLKEVILLDADVILLRDPATLRNTSTGYNTTGTVFFHDRIHFMRKFLNAELETGQQMLQHMLRTFDYGRFNLTAPASPSDFMPQSFAYRQESGHEMDSSMVLINKQRAGRAMEILLYLILEVRFTLAFSWGDKEAFWLAYELAQQDYLFSPFGLSLIDSVPNKDLTEHRDTLCGSMAHYVPTEDATEAPELLYVNGKALLDPFAVGIDKLGTVGRSRLFNPNPTHVTPRYLYSDFDLASRETFECMDNLGATPLPEAFRTHLLRRRHHFFAAEMGVLDALDRCDV